MTKGVALSAVAVLGAACGSSASSGGATGGAPSSGGAYELGATLPLSGPLAFVGTQTRSVMQAWVDSVNASGGVNRHKVKITFLDDTGTDPTKTAANVVQLVTQDHASAILGFSVSNGCTSSVAQATRNSVPILCGAVDPNDVNPVQRYVYLAGNLEVNEVAPALQFASQKVSVSHPSIAILHEDDEGADAFATKLASDAKRRGWTVSSNVTVPLTATSISAQASQIAAAKPNIVFGELLPALVTPLVKTLRADGIQAPYISEADGLGYGGLQATNDANTYTLYPTRFLSATTNQSQAEAFVSALGTQGLSGDANLNSGLGIQTALGAMVATTALSHCSYPCSGSAMATALEHTSLNIGGIISGFKYSASDHEGVTSYNVYGWNPSTQTATEVASDLAAGD